MGRRYYKRRRKQDGILGLIILFAILIYSWLGEMALILLIGLGLMALIGFLIYKFAKPTKTNINFSENIQVNSIDKEPDKYHSKELMTAAEKSFYLTLSEIVGEEFIVQPQINLATIINKESASKYQNELYRNIDFGIFRKSNYQLLLLIELNDKTHNDTKRRQRDIKVKEICEKANLPLIAFWLNMPNTKDYVTNRIMAFLN